MYKRELYELLKYVKENVGFYRNIPDDIDRIHTTDDERITDIFQTISIVTKQQIKSGYQQFVSKELLKYSIDHLFSMDRNFNKEEIFSFPEFNIAVEYTSGTSGVPFVSLKTSDERLALGRNMWKRRNAFYPAKPNDFFYFIHTFTNSLYPFPFAEPRDPEEKIVAELDFLSASPHSWWHINTFILEYYYEYLKDHPYRFTNLQVIENNGSYISDEEKTKYQEIFGCKVANNYGCREVWNMAYDCSQDHLHVNENSIVLELVDDAGNIITEPNTVGNVVITSLKQRIMPFIRYQIGDIGYYPAGECACGNKSKRIHILPGRHMIEGTSLYGNKCFKDTISYLNKHFHIARFHSISITQTDYTDFTVNIKGNMEERSAIEKSFIAAANYILNKPGYNYSFTYNDAVEPKSIFNVKLKRSNL